MRVITSVKEEIRRLGWKIRYVPHEIIQDFNACYRVKYKEKIIYPPAADRLNIPLNEIWLSERLREYEEYVLFHELREIMYRYQGYDTREAHLRARIDEAKRFCNEPKWLRYFEEFPDYSVPLRCLKELCEAIRSGIDASNALFKILAKCIERLKELAEP